ncbi:MAG: sigma-70 family RNA polymerase sigma factor [Oscillospiraceae bacterium]|nr:sigma-70 family RNA polymerase sigma factor [Oscillospiraceae bacterium]
MTGSELESYIRLFHRSVYRLALSYVKNEAEAEDICQTTFCRLLDYNGEFAAAENCKAWLFRVTINLSKNLLKSTRFSRTAELDENIPARRGFSDEETALWETVSKLPPKYRAAIHLYYYEGYSINEIADITGDSVSTVTTRLARAREKLKKLLLREGIYDEKGIQRNV